MSRITPSRGLSRGLSQGLSIGQVSRITDVNIETIRYYERIGVVPKPARTQGHHRLYEPADLDRLQFIKRSRALGFSLEDIRGLLHLVDEKNFTCAEIHGITMSHLADIHAKIADLRRMENVLTEMAMKCETGAVPACPIIDALSGNSPVQ